MSKPLILGPERTWGETTCHFGLVASEQCSNQASHHFLWLNDNTISNACDEHAAYIHSRDTTSTPFDEHSFGPECGMPGAHWRIPYEDQPEGYCFFPAPDDASLLAEQVEPVTVTDPGVVNTRNATHP